MVAPLGAPNQTLKEEKLVADIAVFIVADRVRQGRERRALRFFAAGREYFEGLEKQKAIESFEAGIAGPAAPTDIRISGWCGAQRTNSARFVKARSFGG